MLYLLLRISIHFLLIHEKEKVIRMTSLCVARMHFAGRRLEFLLHGGGSFKPALH
jgi:hypothetical protein